MQCNPLSRLQRSEFVNLENLFEHIRKFRVYSSYNQERTKKKRESDSAKKELVKESSQFSIKKSSKSITQKSKKSSVPKSEFKTSVKFNKTLKFTSKSGQIKPNIKLIDSIQPSEKHSDNVITTEAKVILKTIFNDKLEKKPTLQRLTRTAPKTTRRYSLVKGECPNVEEMSKEKYVRHTTRRHSNPAVHNSLRPSFQNSKSQEGN